jgi:CelD/BcsL family acetyltransferase involved in cellulose biosynthesis
MSERDRIEIVTGVDTLAGLADEWEPLAEATGLPMLSHAWILSCARTFHADDDLHIVAVYRHGRLAAAAPLVSRSHAGIRRLELIGAASLSEPSGLLHDGDDALDALLRAMLDAGTPVLLSKVPSSMSIAARLSSLGRGVVASPRPAFTLAVPIESSWDAYLERLSSRRRYDLRRARRRAEQAGKLRVRIITPSPIDVDGHFGELVQVEAESWKARNGSSLHQRDELRAFFLQYARLGAASGRIRFSFLDIDERPVAGQLSVEYADRLWVLKIGYDERWSRCSPGWQLLAETMRDAFDRKLRSYEFLGNDDPWLHGWETQSRELDTVAWYPANVSGIYRLAADTAGRVKTRVESLSRGMHQ